MSRRSLVLATLAALLLSACGADVPAREEATTLAAAPSSTTEPATTATSTTEPDQTDDAVLIVALGAVSSNADGSLEICPPPDESCAGIPLVGDVAPPDGASPIMRITGWYDGATLAVVDAQIPDLSDVTDHDTATPCEDLRGKPAGNPPPDAQNAIGAYVESIPDRFAGMWWDSASGVVNVWLTGEDLEDHRTALEEAGGDELPVCVIGGAEYSLAELEDMQQRLFDVIDPKATALSATYIDTLSNRISATMEYLDAPTRALAAREFGDAVVFWTFIEVLEATIADLPQPVPAQAGTVELLTQSGRAGGGMDALGRFTLSFDPDLGCVYFPGGGDTAGGAGRTVPVWPFGYTAVSNPLRIYDHDGELVAEEGDVIETGGGSVGPPRSDDPANCDATDSWIMSSRPEVVGP